MKQEKKLTYNEQESLIQRLRRESTRWWGYGILIGFLMGTAFGMYYVKIALISDGYKFEKIKSK